MKAGDFTEKGRNVFFLLNLNSIAASKNKRKITAAPFKLVSHDKQGLSLDFIQKSTFIYASSVR